MYVFICEDHLEGILTGVYDACASRLGHRNIRLMTGEPDNFQLFSEYITVTPSAQKAEKVIQRITYFPILPSILQTDFRLRIL